jgi:hypothetical protein
MRSKFVIVSFGLLLTAALWADEPELKTVDRLPAARHGTTVDFVATPVAAAKLAAKQKKLVLVLHVSGYFEDPNCT